MLRIDGREVAELVFSVEKSAPLRSHPMTMPVALSAPSKNVAYGIAALVTLALSIHFAVSLPDAIERGREGCGAPRTPCRVLKPAPFNPIFGKLPARAPDFPAPNTTGRWSLCPACGAASSC